MQRYSIDAATAFGMLIRGSQHTILPVNDLAPNIIEHGPGGTYEDSPGPRRTMPRRQGVISALSVTEVILLK